MEAKLCQACRLPACVCPPAPATASIEILVVRHFLERHKMSGTARLVPLAVSGARIVDVGGRDSVARDQLTDEHPSGTFLLFPGGAAVADAAATIRRLVVPDGTWAQARRMRSRVPMLAALPSVSLPEGSEALRLRDPRYRGELPTAEAIARALEVTGNAAAAALLRELYAKMHRQLTGGGRRSSVFGSTGC